MAPFRSALILPILVMWLGIGEAMKVVFLFLGAVVYLIPMVRDAIVAVPSTYWISARDLGATPWEAIRHAVLPIAMPPIADGVIVSISVMWTYNTVAEYVNAKVGLGQLIHNAALLGHGSSLRRDLRHHRLGTRDLCPHDGDKKEALSMGDGLVRLHARILAQGGPCMLLGTPRLASVPGVPDRSVPIATPPC